MEPVEEELARWAVATCLSCLRAADASHCRPAVGPWITAGDELLAAATVYAESIVRPLQQGTDATVDEFFDAAGISIVSIGRAVARRAAALRAEHQSLRLPDAMSLATAIVTDSALLTLHKQLRRIARRVQPSL